MHGVLVEAVRPLVLARAKKYEEDLKAAKLLAVAGGGKPQKRQHSAGPGSGTNSVPETPPLQASQVGPAVQVLRAVSKNPDLLASKVCKHLRTALHPLVEAYLREMKSSPAFRVTCLLGQRERWMDALPVLSGLRAEDLRKRPKLGAYQRWVRELNVAEGDPREIAMLDSVMRVASGLPPDQVPPPKEGSVERYPPFAPVVTSTPPVEQTAGPLDVGPAEAATDRARGAEDETHVSAANKLFSLIATRREEAKDSFASQGSFIVVAHEAAHSRTPPNHFDLDIYATALHTPGALGLGDAGHVTKTDVPAVEGAFVLTDVLSTPECDAMRAASERIGYKFDVPLSSDLDERAQNVVMLVSNEQHDALFARVRGVLPSEIDGHMLCGLNRRWRLYRYQEGNLYRKHLDGAWPASGTRNVGGREEYVYDAHGGSTRSKLTFIVYLNDDFEGGETTFFVPRPGMPGVLEQRPVQPRLGCACVFSHGETRVPLLHEGSAVKRGTKYLLRTEVLYVAPDSPEALRDAARLRGLARRIGLQAKEDEEENESVGDEEDTAITGNKVGKRSKKRSSKRKVDVAHGTEKVAKKGFKQGKVAGAAKKSGKGRGKGKAVTRKKMSGKKPGKRG